MSDLTRSVPFELTRAVNNGDGLTMEGYAAVFNEPTRIDSWEGTFDERVKRGAFKKTIAERTPVLQFDHGAHPLIGSIPIGKIESLSEDMQGLKVSARLANNWLTEPIRDAIANGSVDGMSFRFQVVREEWTDAKGVRITDAHDLMQRLYNADPNEPPLTRTLLEVRMVELGPVVFPAYPQTSVSVRAQSMADRIQTDAKHRRSVLRSIAGVSDDAPFNSEVPEDLRKEVARAILFGSNEQESAPSVEDTRSNETDTPLSDEHLSRTAVSVHHTATVDTPWDGGANEKRLDSPMSLATAKKMYAWYDAAQVADGEVTKSACKFPHHEVNSDGTPGAANLPACRNGLARLSNSSVPASEQAGVKSHLRAHIDDANADSGNSNEPVETVTREVKDRLKRDASYRSEYLSLIQKGSDRYER